MPTSRLDCDNTAEKAFFQLSPLKTHRPYVSLIIIIIIIII